MDRYTLETFHWLELRFNPLTYSHFGKSYEPYQPLRGLCDGAIGPNDVLGAARWVRLLARLRAQGPGSFLDVGGAEGGVARLVRDVFDVPVVSVDLSHQAGLRAAEFSGVPAAAVDSSRLPFGDRSFDFVFLSEVLEHLANPVRTLLELRRVARRGVIVTTEAFAPTEAARQEELDDRRLSPHMDRSIFCPDDFALAFAGFRLAISNQIARLPDPLPRTVDDLAAVLRGGFPTDDLAPPAHGIVVSALRDEAPVSDAVFRAAMVEIVVERLRPRDLVAAPLDPTAAIDPALLAQLRCPVTGAALRAEPPARLVATGGAPTYQVACGVPCLVTPPDTAFSRSLRELAEAELGVGAPVVADLLALDAKLALDLPQPVADDVFLTAHAEGWETAGDVTLAVADRAVTLSASSADPMLLSPRLRRPLTGVRGFRIEIAARAAQRATEQVQVYWWTLQRPLWWEAASVAASYPADGAFHEITLTLPPGLEALFPADDELLRLRLDPSHDPAEVTIRRFEILPRSR